jgi:uncharacterized protein YceK
MKKIIVGSIIAIMLGGCASIRQKRIERICQTCPEKTRADSQNNDSTSVKEKSTIEHDTITEYVTDSSWYHALLKCKDGSVPEIVNEKTKEGSRTKIKPKIDSSGMLKVSCLFEDSLKHVITTKNKEIEFYRLKDLRQSETKTIVIDLKWWQKALMYFGGFSFIYFALRFAFRRFEARMNK